MTGALRSWSRALTLVALLMATGACEKKRTLPIEPIGGDFSLTDHNSQSFALPSLRGKVVLVFFGYSYCPDVCPTTLSKLCLLYTSRCV